MISFCKNCKFWTDQTVCGEINKRRCKEMEDRDFLWNEAYDQEGLFTEPDFGCVLFQPKE